MEPEAASSLNRNVEVTRSLTHLPTVTAAVTLERSVFGLVDFNQPRAFPRPVLKVTLQRATPQPTFTSDAVSRDVCGRTVMFYGNPDAVIALEDLRRREAPDATELQRTSSRTALVRRFTDVDIGNGGVAARPEIAVAVADRVAPSGAVMADPLIRFIGGAPALSGTTRDMNTGTAEDDEGRVLQALGATAPGDNGTAWSAHFGPWRAGTFSPSHPVRFSDDGLSLVIPVAGAEPFFVSANAVFEITLPPVCVAPVVEHIAVPKSGSSASAAAGVGPADPTPAPATHPLPEAASVSRPTGGSSRSGSSGATEARALEAQFLSGETVPQLTAIAPAPVVFRIENPHRTALGRLMTFSTLLSAALAAVATVTGSLFALFVPQIIALVSSSSCAPSEMRSEGVILSFILTPLQVNAETAEDRSWSLLRTTLALVFVAVAAEAIHLIARLCVQGEMYKRDVLRALVLTKSRNWRRALREKSKADRSLEMLDGDAALLSPLPRPSPAVRETPSPAAVSHRSSPKGTPAATPGPQHGAKSGEESDPPAPVIVTKRSRQSVTRGGFAPETEQERAALARSVDTIEEYYTEVGKPKPWLSAAPLPPLIGLMALSALAAGCTEHATRVLFASTSNLKQLVAIATVFATVLVLPMVIIVVTRAPLRFIPYFATKGKIPLWLRPAGVWGPNALRLTLGVLVEDFAHSRKSLGALFFFTRNLVALFAGLDLESSGSCATAAWVQAFVFLGLAALTVVLRPFRSKFLFATGVLSVSATFLFLVAYLVHTAYFLNESSATSPLSTTANPNQSGSDHWSVVALFITAAVASVASVLSVAGQLAVALWETVQFSAFAHVHRDGTHESGVSVVQPVDSMLDEMLAVYNAGPAEPLDSEDAAHAGLASLDSRAVILQSKIPRPLAAKNNAAAQPPATTGSKRRDKRRGSRVRFNDEVEVEPSDRRPPSDRKDRRPQRDPELDSDEAGPTGAFAGGMSLADYLMSDFDALPAQTQAAVVLERRLEERRLQERRDGGDLGLPPLPVSAALPARVLAEMDNPHFARPRTKPPVNFRHL